MKDLIVLVADKNMEHALRGILRRSKALNIGQSPVTFSSTRGEIRAFSTMLPIF